MKKETKRKGKQYINMSWKWKLKLKFNKAQRWSCRCTGHWLYHFWEVLCEKVSGTRQGKEGKIYLLTCVLICKNSKQK